ncbi:sodium/solute symporter [bacterium]|nr:sodium/solute symporter [bacterium]
MSENAADARIHEERGEYRGLRWPDWIVIAGYIAFMLGIGLFYLHRQKNTEDYLLGGRKIHPVASGISLFATMISTISYLAYPGEVIRHGPTVLLLYIASLPVIYLIMGYGLIPLLMRLPVTSAYEILEKPLGTGVRLFGSAIFVLTRLAWMALLIFLAAKSMVVMVNGKTELIPIIITVVGVVTLIYSSMGGLRAVVVTDVAQFFILAAGAMLTMLFVTVAMGGPLTWFPTSWAPNWDSFVVFSIDPHVRVTVVGSMVFTIVWWVCTAGADQMAIQRYLSTRDVRAARRAFFTNNCADITITVLLGLVGFALLGFFRGNPHLVGDGKSITGDTDFLFPHYIANFLPVGVSGLVVAGLLSAAMSSLSSGINSTATVVVSDFIDRFRKRTDSEIHHVKIARYISIAAGVIVILTGTCMEKVPGNIMEVTSKTNGLFVAPLFSLFFMALFVPFATPFGAVFGSIYGWCCGGFFAFWDVITGQPGLSFLWILPVSLACSILFGMLFSMVPSRGKSWKVISVWSLALLVPPVTTYVILSGKILLW